MKNILTIIGLSTVLLIASTAQADVSENNYNAHANNHVSYASAHSGEAVKKSKVSKQTNVTTNRMINDDPFYNAEKDPFSLDYSHDD
ncbi:MAG: hypothetical protein L3J51_08345 [Cocleimonas sp.]|nr:hypothetical protein [Cocleimonas sp.]